MGSTDGFELSFVSSVLSLQVLVNLIQLLLKSDSFCLLEGLSLNQLNILKVEISSFLLCSVSFTFG